MIDTSIFLEKFLQAYRFKMVRPYLIGDVLDFGGNEGELKKMVKGSYLLVNQDHSAMENVHFNTIVGLAVLEHISVEEDYEIFRKFKLILNNKGRIFITTPTKTAKPVLEFLAFIGAIGKKNIEEHKHYWDKKEIIDLATETGFVLKEYKKFQFGFNQLAVFEHAP